MMHKYSIYEIALAIFYTVS